MILVFTGFAAVFSDMGFGAALIQKLDLQQRHKNAAFWCSIAAGALATLVFAGMAPLIASFYGVPALQPITVAISVVFFIYAFATVKVALLLKAMNLRTIAAIQLASTVLSGVLAIYLASTGFGVWSLVAFNVASAIFYVLALWIVTPWRPDFSFQWDALKDLSKFSTNVLGYSAFTYWTRNLDNLLIGRYLGSAALGIYARSYTIFLMPVWELSGVVSNVMFPAFSAIQKDVERMRDLYLKSISVISLWTFPLSLGLLVLSRPFVLTFFGDKWAAMIPILQVFGLLGTIQSVGATVHWVYQSQGRTDIMFRWGLVSGSIKIASFVVGLRWGALGVAVAYTVANFLLWYPSWSIPARLIKLDFITIVRRLAPAFCGAAVMAVAVWALGGILPNSWSSATHLALQGAFGIAVYWIFVRSLRLDAYLTVVNMAKLYLRDLGVR